MAQILKGAPVAAALSDDLIKRAEKLRASGVVPTLAILRVGERPDDISYETGAIKRCEKIGIQVKRFLFPASCDRETLLNAISEINADDSIHGCLMFRPLPNKEDEAAACAMLSPGLYDLWFSVQCVHRKRGWVSSLHRSGVHRAFGLLRHRTFRETGSCHWP